ncbi:DUF3899 domain-containing protein [Staphylococcus aureus]
MLKKWLGMALITPILTFIIWLFNSHTIITYLNILFYVSLIIFISIFLFYLYKKAFLMPTSYGFRRLKYQMSSSKKKKSISDDPFFNPQEVKKEALLCFYMDNPLIINKYFIFYYDDCAVAHLSIKETEKIFSN